MEKAENKHAADVKKMLQKYHIYLKLEKGFSDNTLDAYERDLDKFLGFLDSGGLHPFDVGLEHLHEFSASLID
ncbi:MAG: site-specific integrase, partial [Bacteroidaceae bacterium]|nr:site-specific integrase [Bacteroidaceae bacterium]